MANKKKNQIRAEFRKSYDGRTRKRDFTRETVDQPDRMEDLAGGERLSGKGRLTRKRTVTGSTAQQPGSAFGVELDPVDESCLAGRVLKVFGLVSVVRTPLGDYHCSTRGVLKSLATGLQHTVVAGDHVSVLPSGVRTNEASEGTIVAILPRRNSLCRTSRKKQQIIAANVDQVLVIASAAQPDLKPNLVDRFLLSIEKAGLQPVVVINKTDLVEPGDFVRIFGVWGQLGYPVLAVSATTGAGIWQLRRLLQGRDSVVAGQSGVGKSSLLNAVQPGLERRVGSVSEENQKGRHTTTTAELVPLEGGGHIVDTPGIRSMQLWDVSPEEVEGYFRELRPFVHQCRFPDCTHTHEEQCAVKSAVADGWIDLRRYDSYCQIRSDL